MDPAKLKVVELREELQARGLNTKGVKADLVKRLKEALEKETQTSIPDTSILDTSTEDMDTSQDPLAMEEKSPTKKDKKVVTPVESSPKKAEPKQEEKSADAAKAEEHTGDNTGENGADEYEQNEGESEGDHDENGEAKTAEDEDAEGEGEPTGEKRKRESDQEDDEKEKKRWERAPIKEDEPDLDYGKTLLSWFDSDLLLQFDKDNFLSAKPISDGAMGYIWNSVRATHGISSGKICYEVKLTEALKWEDLTKQFTIPERPDWYQKKMRDEKKKEEVKKQQDQGKVEGGDSKNENAEGEEGKKEETEEKMETDATQEKVEEASGDVKTEESEENPEESKKEGEEKEEPKKEEPPKEPIPTHLFRVGFSLGGTSLQLGENKYSYGYENTGRFVNDKNFTDYAVTFGEGDVVGAFLSIDDKQVTITYTVNGAVQPVAMMIPRSEFPEQNFILYPHLSSRNFAFELNFGDQEEPWFPIPEELKSYSFLSKVEDKVAGPVRPETRKDCEVYLMIGLPAAGKSRWVSEHIKNNPDKQYTVIGNHSLLEKMTVDGQSIRQRFAGSWKILNDRLQKCLNRLTDVAAVRRRHFIIDQTNLFQAAQRRKMRAFEGYQRKAVVVVPDEEEQNRRLKLQVEQDGKSIPEQTVWELKAGMEIPEKVDWLEETIWPELDEEKAKEVVKKYNEEAKAKGYTKRFPRRQNQRWGNGRDRWGNNRYGDWNSWGRQGGGWDRRDRGPPRQAGWKDYDNRRGGYGGGGGGYGAGNRRGGGGGWGQQGWGGGRQGGGWNQQMYSGYNKWNQEGWGGYGQGWGQGWGNQGGGQGGQGGNRQNWNYYGQYGNQGGGWQQQGDKQQHAGYDYSAD